MKDCLKLIELLKRYGLKISCAESCTGGLVSKSITDISGVSSVFYGGVVSYDYSVKTRILGVSERTLEAFGAVSSQTAEEMAMGVCKACGTEVGISTTGIAGPDGGTPEKPVGTVYVGVCVNDKVYSKRLNISPSLSREKIRERATELLFELAVDKITQNY